MLAIGVLEENGAVTHGQLREIPVKGMPLRGWPIEIARPLATLAPDRDAALALLNAEASAADMPPLLWSPDIVHFIAATAGMKVYPVSLVLCADGWVGWNSTAGTSFRERTEKTEQLAELTSRLKGLRVALDDAQWLGGSAATRARETARSVAAAAVAAAKNIDTGREAPPMRRVETALESAVARRRTSTMRRDIAHAARDCDLALHWSRVRLEDRRKKANWLPGADQWLESGDQIIESLDEIAELVSRASGALAVAADAAESSLRTPPRTGARLRHEAREHVSRATAAVSRSMFKDERLAGTTSGLEGILAELRQQCTSAATEKQTVKLRDRTRRAAKTATVAHEAADMARRCARKARLATAHWAGQESRGDDAPATTSGGKQSRAE